QRIGSTARILGRQFCRRPDRRSLSALLGIAEGLSVSRLVSRCEVRDVGSLESAVRSRTGRLVRPRHVHTGQSAVQLPRQDIRASVPVWIQGYLPYLAGRKLESRGVDPALRQKRGQILRRACQPPWKLRLLGLEVPAVELRKSWTEEGHRGHLGPDRARAWAQIRDHLSWHAGAGLEGIHAGPLRQR